MSEDGPIGVMPCACKIALLNDPRTVQDYWTCIVWGRSYEWNNGRGTAKTMTPDEMVLSIEKMHEQGLVSKAPNSKNFMATRGAAQMFCQCSPTDCGNPYNPPEIGPFPATSPSRYKMQIKSTTDCKACQACVKMCVFHAAQLKYNPELNTWKAWVDPNLCMGCGNCALVCPIKNRGLVLARDADHVPDEVPGWFMVEG
jgi:ferredoxin